MPLSKLFKHKGENKAVLLYSTRQEGLSNSTLQPRHTLVHFMNLQNRKTAKDAINNYINHSVNELHKSRNLKKQIAEVLMKH